MSDFDSKAFMKSVTSESGSTDLTALDPALPNADILLLYGQRGEAAADGSVTINGAVIPVPAGAVITLNRADGKYIPSLITGTGITVVAIA